jgi:acetyl-CoA carboxylase carboxyltransferase component
LLAVGSQLLLRKIFAHKEIAWKIAYIYLVDSAGVYLPQDEIFPDKEHFGRILEIMLK